MHTNNVALGYESIALNQPNEFDGNSRSDCSTEVQFGPRKFRIPVVPANMKCVISPEIAVSVALMENFYILHRFEKRNEDAINEFMWKYWSTWEDDYPQTAFDRYYRSISIGVNQADWDLIDKLERNNVDIEYITIDVAHGHQTRVGDLIDYIKKKRPKTFVIAGNICTPQAVKDLENAGADAVKVGIGPGKACTTFLKTGFMSPMFTAVQRCAEVAKVPIIADGGVRSNGDITKALVAGATMVMVGSLFAACKDAPGKTRYTETWYKKLPQWIAGTVHESPYEKWYYGSASTYNKGNTRNIEGTGMWIPGNGMTVTEKMLEIRDDLRSAISYAGGRDLSALTNLKYDVIV